MKKVLFLFVCCIGFVCSSELFAASNLIPKNPPANVHPRLLFMEKDLPKIKENMSNKESSFALQEINDLFRKYDLGGYSDFYAQKNRNFIYCGNIVALTETAALKYALEKDKAMADFAYETFVRCTKSMNIKNLYDDYRPLGQMMFTAAEIYDWCFDALSSGQKRTLIQKAMEYAKQLQIGFPPVKQGALVGHGCEGQLLRALLACGIAFYDEEPVFWEESASRFYMEFVPIRKFIYESKEPNFQGCEYGPYRSIFDLWSYFLITGFGGDDPYDGRLGNWAEFLIYQERPDNLCWRLGDNHLMERDSGNRPRIMTNSFLSYVATENPYTKFFSKKYNEAYGIFKYNMNGENDELLTPAQFLILNKPQIKEKDYSEKSPVYYAPYPMGEYFASTKWNDKNAAAVHAKIGEVFSTNHEHADSGSFEIFCRKILASTSGFYESGNSYRSSNMTRKYLHGSISKNTLLMEPAVANLEDYGGQKLYPEAHLALEEWKNNENYHRAKILCHQENVHNGKGTVFLSGDISNAYKLRSSITRSMLTILTGEDPKPMIFIVYDQIKNKADRNPVFLLHSVVEPEIHENGKVQKILNTGKLQNTTLLPEKVSVKKIGGSGRQWDICGVNMGDKDSSQLKTGNETGWGRIEIRDKDIKKESIEFLNVMQVSPEETQSFAKVQLLSKAQSEDSILIAVDKYKIRLYRDSTKPPKVEGL